MGSDNVTSSKKQPPGDSLESRVHRFEREWAAGRVPDLDEYLADAGVFRTELLIELVHADLEMRLKTGRSARASDYLARFTTLNADPEAASALVVAEFEHRCRIDPKLTPTAFLADYPEYRPRIGERLNRIASTPRRPTANRLPGWPIVPGYEILDRLGEGGMGVVYQARSLHLGRLVALKFLPPEYAQDKSRLDRFRREARITSALNHPHVCTVHDLGEHEGRPFLVMEYIDRRTVGSMTGDPASIPAAARLISQAARGLAAAHAAGVVHRDVKPDNLMVRADGYVKLMDFGLARRLPGSPLGQPDQSAEHGVVAGTVAYMSPEQARGEAIGPPSDIFSLGVVLYELVTGKHPFPANNPLAQLYILNERNPPPPSQYNSAIPPAIEMLLARMLGKDPALRPSAVEVDEALSELRATGTRREPPIPAPKSSQSLRIARLTVGRTAELAALRVAFRSVEQGNGRMVCIAGEPGIGKTTLVEDFLSGLTADSVRYLAARGRCSERFGEAEAYLPVLESLESLLRGPDGAAAGRILRETAPTWHAQLAPSAARVDSRDSSQARMKRELVTFFHELGGAASVVLFIDDLHWADVPTAELLAYLGRHAAGLRLLIVLTYRRDELIASDHPFLGVKRDLQGRGICKDLAPDHLSATDIQEYLRLAFPIHRFPPELAAAVHTRTGGNPLFVTDLLRDLCDRRVMVADCTGWALTGTVADAVRDMPESARGLIRRKLSRLDQGTLKLLNAAAVQGAEFDTAVLARAFKVGPAAVEERIQKLERVHGLVRLVREYEFPDHTLSRKYRFVHALYRDALTTELTPARRAKLSKALADALLGLHRGKPGLAAGELALLYETAREFVNAASMFQAAAVNAAQLLAPAEAVALARRGLTQLSGQTETPDSRVVELQLLSTLGLQLQVTQGYAAVEVEAVYGRALSLLERAPAAVPRFPILWGSWLYYKVRSDLPRAASMAEELVVLAETARDNSLRMQAYQAKTVVALCSGRPRDAVATMDSARDLYHTARHEVLTSQYGQDPGVACLSFGSVALWILGEPETALARSREAVALARAATHPNSLALSLHFAAMLHQLRGDLAGVRESAGEVLAVALEHRFAFWHAGANILLGWAAAQAGEPNGLELTRQGLSAWTATGSRTYLTYFLGLMADIQLRSNELHAASRTLDEAQALVGPTGERLYEPELLRLRGELALRSGDRAAAAGQFQNAIRAANEQSAVGFLRMAEEAVRRTEGN